MTGKTVDQAAAEISHSGLAALNAEPGDMLNSLILSASLIVSHVRQITISEAAETVREAINSKEALNIFQS